MSAKEPKIVKEEKMPNSQALSLFSETGKDGVMERIRFKIKDALTDRKQKFLNWFAKEFELDKRKLKRLQAGTEPVNFHFFEKIQEALDISIDDILGQPSFTPKKRKYWSQQLKSMPMAVTGPSKEHATNRPIRNKRNKNTELLFYIRRRAIHEIAWDE